MSLNGDGKKGQKGGIMREENLAAGDNKDYASEETAFVHRSIFCS